MLSPIKEAVSAIGMSSVISFHELEVVKGGADFSHAICNFVGRSAPPWRPCLGSGLGTAGQGAGLDSLGPNGHSGTDFLITFSSSSFLPKIPIASTYKPRTCD